MMSRRTVTSIDVDQGCPRCDGLLVDTRLETDLLDTSEPLYPRAWRCVNCGSVLDSKILRNQTLMTTRDSFVDLPESDVGERPLRRRARIRFPKWSLEEE